MKKEWLVVVVVVSKEMEKKSVGGTTRWTTRKCVSKRPANAKTQLGSLATSNKLLERRNYAMNFILFREESRQNDRFSYLFIWMEVEAAQGRMLV